MECKVNESNILISVIMPAYNAEMFIATAIDSVMEQTIEEALELLVIDDCSADGTKKVVEERIAYYANNPILGRKMMFFQNPENRGVAETRNFGIRNAKGAYIAFLDADDWWDIHKLEKQLLCIRQSGAVLCATGRELMNSDGTSQGKMIPIPRELSYPKLLYTNSIPCSSVVLQTKVAREFYMCHDELHEDYIMWLQILKKYQSAVGINEPLLKSRMSQGGKSRNKLKSAKMQYGVYRYMGFGPMKSALLMVSYMFLGVMKYSGFITIQK